MKRIAALLLALLGSPLALATPAYTLVTTSTANDDNTGADFTANMPASIVAGNLLLECTRSIGTSETLTAQTGWTVLKTQTDTRGSIVLAGKIAVGSDSGPTVSWSGADHAWAQVTQFSGSVYTDLSTIVSASNNATANSEDISIPSSTPADDNTLVIACGGHNKTATGNGATVTISGGYSSIGTGSFTGSRQEVGWGYSQQTTATVINAVTWVLSVHEGSTHGTTGITVALKTLAVPTFSVAPAVGTRTTSSIPITATTACTDCNFYGVAVTDGSGAPTCTQIKAGQNSGGTSAYKSFGPVAMTTTVQNTGTFSTYTDGTIRDSYYCLNSTAGGDSAVSSIADIYKIPVAACTFNSSAAGSSTYDCTLDGAGTVFGVACLKGKTAATVTQTEAGQCTGGVAAEANNSRSGTGSLTVGSALANPLYDFYFAGTYGSQHEAAVHSDSARALTAPANFQFIAITSIGVGSPCERFNTATNPDIANGDYLKAPTTTSPGSFALTIGADCQFGYSGDASRQLALNVAVYDTSAFAYHADDIDFVANNLSPICDAPFTTGALKINVDSFSLDYSATCPDPEGDTETCAKTSGTYSTGLTLSTCTLSGTPSVENESGDTSTTTVTDQYGATATQDLTTYPINTITAPDCTTSHLEVGNCINALQAILLDAGTISFSYSATVAAGNVISQSPAAAAEVDTPWTVDLVVSRGFRSPALFRNSLSIGLGIH